MNVYMPKRINKCVCVCVCVYVYIYIYIQGVQLKSGRYFNIINLFTTCYITHLNFLTEAGSEEDHMQRTRAKFIALQKIKLPLLHLLERGKTQCRYAGELC
jgi:hypothetical protein